MNMEKMCGEFKYLKLREKIEYLSNFVKETGFIRIRDFIVDWPYQSNNLSWLIKELFEIGKQNEIDVQKICSELKFWTSQIEISFVFPVIPMLMCSFYIHNKKYDMAKHYLRIAFSFTITIKHSWYNLYCAYLFCFLDLIEKEEEIIIEKAAELVRKNEFVSAEQLLNEYLKLSPFSAKVYDELLHIEKLKNYSNWTSEESMQYRINYHEKIYKNCDPFFINGNILNVGEEKLNNSYRKKIIENNELYEAYYYCILLNEPIMEATIAIVLFSFENEQGNTPNLRFYALSLSHIVDEKIKKIEETLTEYLQDN